MWRGRIGHTEGSPYYHLFLCQESFLLSFNTNYRKYCVRFYFPTSNSAFENRRYFPPHDIWPLRISTGLSVSIADQKKSSFQVFDKPSIITGDTEEEFGRVSILVVFSFSFLTTSGPNPRRGQSGACEVQSGWVLWTSKNHWGRFWIIIRQLPFEVARAFVMFFQSQALFTYWAA